MPKVKPTLPAEPRARARQVAALSYRKSRDGELQFLLISSRTTRRFILPKGWRMKGKTGAKAAAIEAHEEAGVFGKVAKKPFGSYRYFKRTDSEFILVKVDVYPLEVKGQRGKWLESSERAQSWLCLEDAATLLDEPALVTLLRNFAASQR
jgi:8-oxo-dGTP pyrophosphatase MutT (NUDIX family)